MRSDRTEGASPQPDLALSASPATQVSLASRGALQGGELLVTTAGPAVETTAAPIDGVAPPVVIPLAEERYQWVKFRYFAGPFPLKNVYLEGTWDPERVAEGITSSDEAQRKGLHVPLSSPDHARLRMKPVEGGVYEVEVPFPRACADWYFEYRIVGDGPLGDNISLMMGERAQEGFHLRRGLQEIHQDFTRIDWMGARRVDGSPDGSAAFRLAVPAEHAFVQILGRDGRTSRHRMARDLATGGWRLDLPDGEALRGRRYAYEIVPPGGGALRPASPWRDLGPDGVSFRFWAPGVHSVTARVEHRDGTVERFPMTYEPATETWHTLVPGAWSRLKNTEYIYEVVKTAGAAPVDNLDEYAVEVLGGQRGLNRFYAHGQTGQELSRWGEGADGAVQKPPEQLMRFEVQDVPDAEEAYLVLMRDDGTPLAGDALRALLGPGWTKLADTRVLGKAEVGAFNVDLATGRIRLACAQGPLRTGAGFSTLLAKAPGLEGLRYELQAWVRRENQLVLKGAADGRSFATDAERRASGYNDAVDNRISSESGITNRRSRIGSTDYIWTRPKVRAADNAVTLQVHAEAVLGSFQNAKRSNYKDLIDRYVDHLLRQKIGRVQFLPNSAVSGRNRWWAYDMPQNLGVNESHGYLAVRHRKGWRPRRRPRDRTETEHRAVALARANRLFGEDPLREQRHVTRPPLESWISGGRAFKFLVDRLHAAGIEVGIDAVYNHALDNEALRGRGGPDDDRYMDWSHTIPQQPRRASKGYGPAAALNERSVQRFCNDHTLAFVLFYGVDWARMDFFRSIREVHQASSREFARGWNRRLHSAQARSVVEDYSVGREIVSNDVDPDSAEPRPHRVEGFAIDDPHNDRIPEFGFDYLWFNEFYKTVIRDSDGSNPAAALQSVARGWGFMIQRLAALAERGQDGIGYGGLMTQADNHDELKVAGRTSVVLQQNGNIQAFPPDFVRAFSRGVHALAMFWPGLVTFFQGTEFMAENYGHDGVASVWDLPWDWADLGKDDAFWGQVRMNEALKGQSLELARKPEWQRSTDPAYCALSTANQELVRLMASKPEGERERLAAAITRGLFARMHRDAAGHRVSSAAFNANVWVTQSFVDSDRRVLGFQREIAPGQDAYFVLYSLDRDTLYDHEVVLPPGQWREVFNSDSEVYGGSNAGNGSQAFEGGQKVRMTLPAGSTLLLQRVDVQRAPAPGPTFIDPRTLRPLPTALP